MRLMHVESAAPSRSTRSISCSTSFRAWVDSNTNSSRRAASNSGLRKRDGGLMDSLPGHRNNRKKLLFRTCKEMNGRTSDRVANHLRRTAPTLAESLRISMTNVIR